MSVEELLAVRLAALDDAALRRDLRRRAGHDFASNDYLGFASDPALTERLRAALAGTPSGAAGSRLLRGHLELHEEVEAELAEFSGAETALLFPSGYQANLALLTALLRKGDILYSDASNHASLIDAARLSRAERRIFPHGDLAVLEKLLESDARAGGMRLIAVESLYSMDGDLADLPALAELATRHHAGLVVDEAHATGLWGRGGGRVDALGLRSKVLATVHTGGKALGTGGAWIAGSAGLKDYLVNFSRPVIFSTAATPALALLLRESARHWREDGRGEARAAAVLARAAAFRDALRAAAGARAQVPAGDGPIVPVVLGGNARALAVAAELQAAGFDARAIRPPTVPEGSARLRLTITWPVDDATRAEFVTALGRILGAEARPQK